MIRRRFGEAMRRCFPAAVAVAVPCLLFLSIDDTTIKQILSFCPMLNSTMSVGLMSELSFFATSYAVDEV